MKAFFARAIAMLCFTRRKKMVPRNVVQSHVNVFVDSSARDTSAYPVASKYRAALVEGPLHNVSHVELLDVHVPFSARLVGRDSGDSFVVNGISTARLDSGDYSIAGLLVEAERAMVDAGVDDIRCVIRAPDPGEGSRSERVVFESTAIPAAPFDLDFTRSGALAGVLGFSNRTYSSSSSPSGGSQIWAEHPPNLHAHPYHNTIVMRIDNMPRLKSNNPTMHGAFTVLHKHNPNDSRSKCALLPTSHSLHPPLSKLAAIDVSFTDIYGNAYDFAGRDHTFQLRVFLHPL